MEVAKTCKIPPRHQRKVQSADAHMLKMLSARRCFSSNVKCSIRVVEIAIDVEAKVLLFSWALDWLITSANTMPLYLPLVPSE